MLWPGAIGADGMLDQDPRTSVVRHRAPLWVRRASVPGPPVRSSSPLLALRALVARVVEGVSILSLPPSVFPRHSIILSDHSGGFVPPEQLCHSGGVDALRRLDSPLHSLSPPPPGFYATPEASWTSSSPPTPEDLWATPKDLRPPASPPTPEDLPAEFSRRPVILPLTPGLAPWRPPDPALSAVA